MLDLELVRHEPDRIKALCAQRGADVDVDELLRIDGEHRTAVQRTDELNRQLKDLSRRVAQGEVSREEAKAVSEAAMQSKSAAELLRQQRDEMLGRLPNLLADDTPPGTSDEDNVELRTWGDIPDCEPEKARHDTVGADWGWYDAHHGSLVAGSGYIYWTGPAGELLWDLYDAVLRLLRRRGFTQVFTPVVAKDETFFNTGYLPFVSDDLYTLEGEDVSLIGTSEQTLLGLLTNETVPADRLPLRITAFTPCFRTEKGAAGSKTRGGFRVHQFHKVEQIIVCRPEESDAHLDEAQRNVEDIVQALELPHRVVRVCVGDLGAPGYKKYDTETWFPGFGEFRETHSNTNLTDFQSRRLRLRAKGEDRFFPHTISSTAATDRLFIALFEDLLARGFDEAGALAEGRRRIDALRALA